MRQVYFNHKVANVNILHIQILILISPVDEYPTDSDIFRADCVSWLTNNLEMDLNLCPTVLIVSVLTTISFILQLKLDSSLPSSSFFHYGHSVGPQKQLPSSKIIISLYLLFSLLLLLLLYFINVVFFFKV